jgi:hypothetical protein
MSGFQLHQRGDITFLTCQPLEQAGYVHAFSTRRQGVSPLPENALNLGFCQTDAPDHVRENRRRFLAAIGAPEMKLFTVKQIHSADIIAAGQDDHAGSLNRCDAIVAEASGLLLGVQTADCVPILMADVQRRAMAAVHAGWRGTRARIVEKALIRLQKEFGTRPEDCLAAIGPAARVCCYEVGEDVIEPFRAEFAWADAIISNHTPNGKAHLDVPAGNRRQLMSAGVPESNIFTANLCTMCRNDLFFSHRLEHARGVGRMLSVIGCK